MPDLDDAAPFGPPTVVSIAIAPATRLPMKAVASVEAEAGKGLVGDRYHGTRHRHVTVQSAADLAEAGTELGSVVEPTATRRNITISHGAIPTKPGERMAIGDVELEVVRIAAPCKLLDDVIGDGARHALRRRAGTVFRVLGSGTISIGDAIELPPSGGEA
jgi:MOSC domain-containing protein YiiM